MLSLEDETCFIKLSFSQSWHVGQIEQADMNLLINWLINLQHRTNTILHRIIIIIIMYQFNLSEKFIKCIDFRPALCNKKRLRQIEQFKCDFFTSSRSQEWNCRSLNWRQAQFALASNFIWLRLQISLQIKTLLHEINVQLIKMHGDCEELIN